MSAAELLNALDFIQPFFFGALAVIAVSLWVRHPSPASAWLAAAFAVLALVVFTARFLPDDPVEPMQLWARKATLAILVLFPYCLYRFMRTFIKPIGWIKPASAILTAGLALGALALPDYPSGDEARPAWFEAYIILLLIQWVSLSGLVAVRLWRAGRRQPVVARRRMRTISIGAAGLALALVVAGESSDGQVADLVVQVLAFTTSPLIILGFWGPRIMRVWWRRDEDERLQESERSLMKATTEQEVAQILLPAVRTLVGAPLALLEDVSGRIIASDGVDTPEAREMAGSLADSSRANEEADDAAVLTFPMSAGRLTLITTPVMPFFGQDEIERLEGFVARADLALVRAQLHENQRNLAQIVESSDDAIISKTLDGTIVTWNRGAQRIYGYQADEVIGKPISILVPEKMENDVPAIIEQIRSGRSLDHYQTKRQTKDGRVLDVSLTVSPVRDPSGAVVGASAIARDISESTRLQAELEEQAQMLDLVEDAVVARDMTGRITYWNKTAESIFGWSKDEAIGQVAHALLKTSFPGSVTSIESEISETERWEGELVHTSKRGEQIVTASRWTLRKDAGGRPFQVLEVNNDITARKKADEERVRQQQLLTAIFQTSPDIIATVTSDREVVYVNPAAREILGYALRELFDQEAPERVHPEDNAVMGELLRNAFGGTTESRRLRVKHVSDAWIWLDIRMRRMGPDGDTAVVMARDITEQVHLEETFKEAKDAAETANLAKSEFLSRMSHELRTPLNAILGFAQLLEMDELADDQRESTEQIIKGGRRLLELINEILDIARIESGQLMLSMEPVLVRDVIEECVTLIRPVGTERGIRIEFEHPVELDAQHVWADRGRLGQVLLNLLSNGVKYNAAEGTVTVTCTGTDHGTIRIGVTDTGPGIPPDKVHLLFTPFERLGAETSGEQGTGLGLALTKSLVEAMEGRILFDSMQGKGTTFWVELPATEEPSEGIREEKRQTEGRLLESGARVLYIEDNLANLTLIARLLQRKGEVDLISAMTGEMGIDLARQHKPDLILLDLDLPDIRGDEVLGRLRRDPLTEGIPIVILSADATSGEINRLLGRGAIDYLTKPVDVNEFLRVLNQVFASPGETG